MSGTDWLRDLVKRKPKFATGGLITADQAPTLATGCAGSGYTVPEPRELPTGVNIALASDYERLAEQIREAAARDRADLAAENCPCIAIYSRCYCHLRTAAR